MAEKCSKEARMVFEKIFIHKKYVILDQLIILGFLTLWMIWTKMRGTSLWS